MEFTSDSKNGRVPGVSSPVFSPFFFWPWGMLQFCEDSSYVPTQQKQFCDVFLEKPERNPKLCWKMLMHPIPRSYLTHPHCMVPMECGEFPGSKKPWTFVVYGAVFRERTDGMGLNGDQMLIHRWCIRWIPLVLTGYYGKSPCLMGISTVNQPCSIVLLYVLPEGHKPNIYHHISTSL